MGSAAPGGVPISGDSAGPAVPDGAAAPAGGPALGDISEAAEPPGVAADGSAPPGDAAAAIDIASTGRACGRSRQTPIAVTIAAMVATISRTTAPRRPASTRASVNDSGIHSSANRPHALLRSLATRPDRALPAASSESSESSSSSSAGRSRQSAGFGTHPDPRLAACAADGGSAPTSAAADRCRPDPVGGATGADDRAV